MIDITRDQRHDDCQKKNHACSSFLLHHVCSFATEVKRSESTLQICEFLCLIFCIIFPFSVWRRLQEARQLNFQECGIQHLFPLPSVLLLSTLKSWFIFVLINTLLSPCVFNKVDASRNQMFLLNLEHHVFWDLLCMQEKSLILQAPLLLLFYILVIRQCHAGY